MFRVSISLYTDQDLDFFFTLPEILKSVLITTAGSIKTIMEDWKEQCLSLMLKGSILNDHIKNVPSLSVP